jgi:hypothetical protein
MSESHSLVTASKVRSISRADEWTEKEVKCVLQSLNAEITRQNTEYQVDDLSRGASGLNFQV